MVAAPCRVPLSCGDWTSSIFPRLRRTAAVPPPCLSKSCSSHNRRLTRPAVNHSVIESISASVEFAFDVATSTCNSLCLHCRPSLRSNRVSFGVPPWHLSQNHIQWTVVLICNTQQFVTKRFNARPPCRIDCLQPFKQFAPTGFDSVTQTCELVPSSKQHW